MGAYGQNMNRVWCFGDSAGIDFSNLTIPKPDSSYMDCPRSCTSISDTLGRLLFYAHSFYWPLWISGSNRNTVVRNRNHEIMTNGDSLICSWNDNLTIIPKPGNDSIYFLLQSNASHNGLYYSLINPYFNNYQGRVISKNIQLPLIDSLMMGVHAIRHANGRDWWIFTREWWQSNLFFVFLVTPDSIIGPELINIGSLTFTDAGTIAISKNGEQLALANFNGLLETYSFDRCTGHIINPLRIENNTSGVHYFGCEFSPSGSVLYVSNSNNAFNGDSLKLIQYDLTSTQPSLTKLLIYNQPVPANGGMLKRGPDDKIYLSCLHECGWPYPDSCRNVYNDNLSVINQPDSLGQACNFAPFSFYLGGKRTYWDLPNIPNYDLREISGSACDSLTNEITKIESENTINIFPNPCSNYINVMSFNSIDRDIKIYDSSCRLIFQGIMKGRFLSIDASDFSEGIYFCRVDKNRVIKVVVIK